VKLMPLSMSTMATPRPSMVGYFGDELVEVHHLVVGAPGEELSLFQIFQTERHMFLPVLLPILRVPHTALPFPPTR